MALGSHSVTLGDTGSGGHGDVDQTVVQLGEFTEDVELRSIVVTADVAGDFSAKAVVYSGGSRIADGTVVSKAATAGESIELPFPSPVSLTALTDYKIGWHRSTGSTTGPRYNLGSVSHTHSSTPSFCDWVDLNAEAHFGSGDMEPTTTAGVEPAIEMRFDALTAITATIATATEADSAQPVSRIKRKAIATVTETDIAPAFARQKARTLATALEADEAVAITATTPGIRVAIATVTETDEAPAITRTDPATFVYRLTFPTYPRTFTPVPIGQTARFVLDQAVSIVRVNGTLRQFRSPSQTQLQAAGTEGVDWFIGGRIYEQIPNDVAIELRLAGFETERVA